MSLAQWKKKYYPIDAESVSQADAVEHSIRKWVGLYKTNLRKCGIKTRYGITLEDRKEIFVVGIGTCALCHHYFSATEKECETCPLAIVRGNVSCDTLNSEIEAIPPYQEFMRSGNVRPMLKWLRKAKQYEDKMK